MFFHKIKKSHIYDALAVILAIISAVFIAEFFKVKFAPSTAVVTFLGLQSTRKANVQLVMQRLISFCYTMVIAICVHYLLGVNTLSFVVCLSIVVMLTILLQWKPTLSINLVLMLHLFMQQLPFTEALLINETKRIFIGIMVAFIYSWKKPKNYYECPRIIYSVESNISDLVTKLSLVVQGDLQLDELQQSLDDLHHKIIQGREAAHNWFENNLATHSDYYIKYMNLRVLEYDIFKSMYENLKNAPTGYQDSDLALYILSLNGKGFKEDNEVQYNQLVDCIAHRDYQSHEFNNKLISTELTHDTHHIFILKKHFFDSLTDKQKEFYY